METLIEPPTARQATAPLGPDAPAESSAADAAHIAEFLAFQLGGEEYGIDILRVREIRSFEPPTRLANAPPHILGVVNLRGAIVPIVDLRLQFRLEPVVYDDCTVTIVLGIGNRTVGIVVDAVSAVITLAPDQLKPVPALHASAQSEHLLGIGTLDDRLLILIDIDKLMTSAAVGLVNGNHV